jgi:hypothetical protein
MFTSKAEKLFSGAALEYTKDELTDVNFLSIFHISKIYSDECGEDFHRDHNPPQGRIWGDYTLSFAFPGTREAIETTMTKIRRLIAGKDLAFASKNLAHVHYVEHCTVFRNHPVSFAKSCTSHIPSPCSSFEDMADTGDVWDVESDTHGYEAYFEPWRTGPILLRFERFQERHSEDLVLQHCRYEEDRAFHTLYKRHLKVVHGATGESSKAEDQSS